MAEEGEVLERLSRYDKLKADRIDFDTLNQAIYDYMHPRKSQIIQKKSVDVSTYTENIFDTTAIEANHVLASGLTTNTTSVTETWMRFEAPAQLVERNNGPVAEQWFQRVSEITMTVLAGTNFYSEIHELHLERNVGGTGCIYVEEGKRFPINFKCIPYGSYVIAQDEEGFVDTVMREFELTARQAVQKFGYDNLGEKVKAAYDSSKNKDKKFCFLHSVYPRTDREPGRYDSMNKPFKSCYDSIEDKVKVQEGGYDEMPYIVSRFLAWPGDVWGYGPGIEALPIVKELNKMEFNMDTLAEVAAFPRLKAPSSMVGRIDMGANGVTYFDESMPAEQQVQAWLTEGRYDIGKDRALDKREAIRRTFYNDLFQMLKNIEAGRLTAYEVSQRVSEKLEQFAPPFQRFTWECLEPISLRVFGILYRGGHYPEAPPEVLEPVGADAEGNSLFALARPKISFQSKMALQIKALENRAFVEWLQVVLPLAPTNPEALDVVNIGRASERIARNLGNPSDTIRTPEEVAELQQQRAEAMQMQQQMAAFEQGAKGVADLSKAASTAQT